MGLEGSVACWGQGGGGFRRAFGRGVFGAVSGFRVGSLVFVWGGALRERFNCYFSQVFSFLLGGWD